MLGFLSVLQLSIKHKCYHPSHHDENPVGDQPKEICWWKLLISGLGIGIFPICYCCYLSNTVARLWTWYSLWLKRSHFTLGFLFENNVPQNPTVNHYLHFSAQLKWWYPPFSATPKCQVGETHPIWYPIFYPILIFRCVRNGEISISHMTFPDWDLRDIHGEKNPYCWWLIPLSPFSDIVQSYEDPMKNHSCWW